MTVIVDYGVGNLFSLCSSLSYIGAESEVSSDPRVIRRADRLILPGVGAFGDAAEKLKMTGLGAAVKAAAGDGVPLLGICLGMQLLLDMSHEYGEHEGLGLIRGEVVPLKSVIRPGLSIPHIGWNSLGILKRDPLYKNVPDGAFVYFVHSYCAASRDSASAVTDYGGEVVASVQSGSVYGCQFHPEKSGETGLEILRSFTEL